MDKTAGRKLYRVFLTEGLPAPLTAASSHLQLFDNYIEGTRLRLRSVRVPETKEWTRSLEQHHTIIIDGAEELETGKIVLNDTEYAIFEPFEGREIRKNRYFHEFDSLPFVFDVHLGKLWGLCIAKVRFASTASREQYEPPPFAVFEITEDPFFFGRNLVEKNFEAVRDEVVRIGAQSRPEADAADA